MLNSTINPKYWLNKPSFFLKNTINLIYIFLFLNIVFFIVNFLLINYNIVVDVQQKETFKMFYMHVPFAWFATLIYTLMVLFSLAFMMNSFKMNDILAYTLAKIGLMFSLLTLITGSFWGKATWGIFWTWDARLTSSFILFLMYFMYIFFKYIFEENYKNALLLAFFCIIGFINMPMLKFSVDWWNTLHQAQSVSSFQMFFNISIYMPLVTLMLNYLFIISLFMLIEMRMNLLKNKISFLKNL